MDTASAATRLVGHGNLRRVTTSSRSPWIALSVVYVLWGSTYLANRFVIPSVPPLLVGGFRFLIGGALLAVIVLCVAGRAAFRWTPAQFGTTALSGLLLPAWATAWSWSRSRGCRPGWPRC